MHWPLWLSQQLSFLLMSLMTVSYKLQLSEVAGFSLCLEIRAEREHVLVSLVSILLLSMLVWVRMMVFFVVFFPFTPMQITVKWVCSSIGNKCSIPLQHKLFYHISSDRWLQHVEPLWAHLGLAAPLIPWYWCRGSPVESEGIGGPSKLEPRRLWVDPHRQQHFHNALLPTQQLRCIAGRVIFSLTFMLELQYLNDTYYIYVLYMYFKSFRRCLNFPTLHLCL